MIEPNEHLKTIYRMSERMPQRLNRIPMDMNERVVPFETQIFSKMLEKIQPDLLCHYPDPSPLYEKLSAHLGYSEDNLYVSPGSDAAIRMLFQTYLRPGDCVVFPDPTFAMYSVYSQIFRATPCKIAYEEDRTLNLDQFFSALKDRPRILAIANPDQPTGSILPPESLRALATAARENNTLFIIDEAYYPFYPESSIDFVQEFENVVVLRTFSKVGGLAGLRVGYFVAHPRIIDHVSRVRGSFEVNTVAIAMACYLLDHPDIGHRHLQEIEEGRTILSQTAHVLGLGFPKCPANFQLLQFKGLPSTSTLVQGLENKGFLVKGGFSAPAVHDCIRVTLTGPALMKKFCDSLTRITEDIQWKCLR